MKNFLIKTFLIISTTLILLELIFSYFDYPLEEKTYACIAPNLNNIYENFEYTNTITTNSDGIRYREISKQDKDKEKILVIGDSYVFGIGVQANETFSSILEQNDTNRMFINLGVPGGGPFQYANIFNRIGLSYNPSKLILCIYGNDLVNTPTGKIDIKLITPEKYLIKRNGFKKLIHHLIPRTYIQLSAVFYKLKRFSENPTENPIFEIPKKFLDKTIIDAYKIGKTKEEINEWISSLDTSLISAANKRKINDSYLTIPLLKPNYYDMCLNINTTESEEKYKNMILLFNLIKDSCDKKEIKLGMIYLPFSSQFDPNFRSRMNNHPLNNKNLIIDQKWLIDSTSVLQNNLLNYCKENSIEYFDLTHLLREETKKGKQLIFNFDQHWNKDGHAFVSEKIKKWLDSINF